MKSKYQFTKRKGRNIQVKFGHLPGKWFSTGTHDMTEAVLWAENKLKSDLHLPSRRKDKIPTLREFAIGFFDDEDPYNWRNRQARKKKKYGEMYYMQQQGRLNNYILPSLGDYLISSITDVVIDDWFMELKGYKNNKEIADNTKNKILNCLRVVLDEAKRQKLISTNSAREVELINAEYGSRIPFSEIEMYQMFPQNENELLKIWGDRTWASYFLVMRDTGFRPGEVAGLTPDQINLKYQGVFTKQSIDFRTRTVKKRIKTSDKGINYKVGLLTKQTVLQLMKLISERNIDDSELLFLTKNNKPIIPDTANKHLKLCLEKINIKPNGRTQYCFRHTFQTDLIGNMDEKVLLQLMAHTRYRKEYDHRTPEKILEQLQPALDIIEKRGYKAE